MEITEVRVKLVEGGKQEKLKAFCSITIDNAFVIRDLKVIEGSKGLFVAMPSRKLTVRCARCSSKNQVRSNYCGECGAGMPRDRNLRGRDGRLKLHADIAHPINSECRDVIQSRVLDDFYGETHAAGQPGYRPLTDGELDFDDGFDFDDDDLVPVARQHRNGESFEVPHKRLADDVDDDASDARRRSRPRFAAESVTPRCTRADNATRRRQRESQRERVATPPRSNGTRPGQPAAAEHQRKDLQERDVPPDDNFGVGIF